MSISNKYYSDSCTEWSSPEYVLDYLRVADKIPHRNEGEQVLLEYIPKDAKKILDLGTGDGRLIKLLRSKQEQQRNERQHQQLSLPLSLIIIAIDVSPAMLEKARNYFKDDNSIRIIEHDLSYPISDKLITEEKEKESERQFDAIISGLAIHHLTHERKYSLYKEVYNLLKPGGVFCNLDHVASPTPRLHKQFLAKTTYKKEDKSNKLLDIQTQLKWLEEIGFIDVDCYWKWLELALLIGIKPVH
ncbi:MAG TPA: class I SAM-dependent methyltransferase [Nitrososphaeraceae archaeon]|nr:class I SAM-dependent methyltransferase [Nitrososphaeraceae archaeon]